MSAVLARRQRWLYAAIVDANGPRNPTKVLGNSAVPAALGLSVYRHAYRARLRDCLADDFTAVAQVMGERAFAKMADVFIAACPPVDATLNAYGRFFPPWLLTTRIAARIRLAELARLEWALVEAIHAATAPSLSGAALAGVAPHAWGTIRLIVTPSLRVLPCRFNTNAVYEAFRIAKPLPAPQRGSGGIAVIRNTDGLMRFTLDADETRVLSRIASKAPLGEALDGLPAARLAMIRNAFARWLTQGFFTALG